MRSISDAVSSDIFHAHDVGILGDLHPAVAEKDQHITDALHALANIRLSHIACHRNRSKGDPRPARIELSTQLVFAGGTCLSKAHRIIERMSEDIDIKVMLEAVPDGYVLPKGQSDRARLGDLHRAVEACLTGLGFGNVKLEQMDNPITRDSRRYYCLMVSYDSRFRDLSGVLRPQLKLELIHRSLELGMEKLEMGYMLDQFVSRKDPLRFSMACISVAETLAEKVLSLLRRCAWKWDGHQRGPLDPTLVRHVYDVWRIATSRPVAMDGALQVFPAVVNKDRLAFRGQHPEFDRDPHGVLSRALKGAATDRALRDDFAQQLTPLVFATEKPDFHTCFTAFHAMARRLLERLLH
ncbi:nucleotidyl transferase AbiEii/AbiGii toxin family protein [Cupriavidus necator]|uniref:nucleotidyl transferase AbiEii/AbiGii toxin family protein n=1 Tax=Cupriavidus necator TaxID=106590 RepID=UPI00339D641D